MPNGQYSPDELDAFQRMDYLIFNEGWFFAGCVFNGKNYETKARKFRKRLRTVKVTSSRPYWVSVDSAGREIKLSTTRLCG
jgi:hypothetical protein